MPKLSDRLRNGWNAFVKNKDPSEDYIQRETYSYISTVRPDRVRFNSGVDRTLVSAIYNRIAIDVADTDVRHVRIDENGKYVETINSDLNNALTADANIDQTGRAMIMDVVMSLCDEGCIAVVPTDTDVDPFKTDSYKIYELRVGEIIQWYPDRVKVKVYNERTGIKEEIICLKSDVAIIENPLFKIMNEPNSTLKRLIRKLSLLDRFDENNTSGKLDMIIQLPYTIKTESRRQQAEQRRNDIEAQLTGSTYGIAYTDGTEKITQLNRPVENNLLAQIQYLTDLLYGQLGLTAEILNGTADENAMANYYARTISPILTAITEEMTRKFLTKTARTQGQAIKYFKDPFKLIPTSMIATIADTFTRNAIMSTNEVRSVIGMKPSDQPGADDLRNKNLNQSNEEIEKTKKGIEKEDVEIKEINTKE